jgi:hypothetical protein
MVLSAAIPFPVAADGAALPSGKGAHVAKKKMKKYSPNLLASMQEVFDNASEKGWQKEQVKHQDAVLVGLTHHVLAPPFRGSLLPCLAHRSF